MRYFTVLEWLADGDSEYKMRSFYKLSDDAVEGFLMDKLRVFEGETSDDYLKEDKFWKSYNGDTHITELKDEHEFEQMKEWDY